MNPAERGRAALERMRARRRGPQPFLDRSTVTLAVIIAVLATGVAWVVDGWRGLHAPTAADFAGFSVYLHRQGCPSQCPVYAVLVRGDGTVEYEGVESVATEGSRRTTLDRLALQALLTAVRRSGVAGAPAAITPGAASCARWSNGRELLRIAATLDGVAHTVDYYPGCEPGDPRLDRLAREIDALAGTERWVVAGAPPDAGAPPGTDARPDADSPTGTP